MQVGTTFGSVGRYATRSFLLVCLSGCSQHPAGVRPPTIDADQAAASAITQYDSDDDGQLGLSELTLAPELLEVKEAYDSDGNEHLSRDEIATGIRSWSATSTGLSQLSFTVRLDGKPLPNAKVSLTPAPFLGDELHAATAITDADGKGMAGIAPEHVPDHLRTTRLVEPGLYRVSITHEGRPVPAKYNTNTELGVAVPSGATQPMWDLKSR